MDPTTPRTPKPNRWVRRDVYKTVLGGRRYREGEYPGAVTHYWTVHKGQRIPLLRDGTCYVPILGHRAQLMFLALLEVAILERRESRLRGNSDLFPHRRGVNVWKHEGELDPLSPTNWEVVLHGTDEEANSILESVMEEITLLRHSILTNR